MISKGRALVRILGTAPSTSTLSEWHSTSELNPYVSGSRLPAAYCFSLWFHLLYQELDCSNKSGNFKWVGVSTLSHCSALSTWRSTVLLFICVQTSYHWCFLCKWFAPAQTIMAMSERFERPSQILAGTVDFKSTPL